MADRPTTPPPAPGRNHTTAMPLAQGQLFAPDEPAKVWTTSRLEVPPLRQCTTCQRLLTVDNFIDNWRTRDGLNSKCKDCNLAQQRKSRGVHHHDLHRRPDPGDRCAICGSDGGTRGLCLDHDHITGRFRDWLCHRCNTALGYLQDDPNLADRASRYLESHRREVA